MFIGYNNWGVFHKWFTLKHIANNRPTNPENRKLSQSQHCRKHAHGFLFPCLSICLSLYHSSSLPPPFLLFFLSANRAHYLWWHCTLSIKLTDMQHEASYNASRHSTCIRAPCNASIIKDLLVAGLQPNSFPGLAISIHKFTRQPFYQMYWIAER